MVTGVAIMNARQTLLIIEREGKWLNQWCLNNHANLDPEIYNKKNANQAPIILRGSICGFRQLN